MWRNGLGVVLAMASLAAWGAEASSGLMKCPEGWEIKIRAGDSALLALWRAAEEGDEAAFADGLKAIPDVDRYSYQGKPLLRALLSPPLSFLKESREQSQLLLEYKNGERQKRYAELVSRKERMFALAARQKLRWQGCDDGDHDIGPPLLFLASYMGSPELLSQAIQAGISPDQDFGRLESGSALEAVLNVDFAYMATNGLPEMPYRRVSGRYIAMLLDAGAKEPYASDRKADARALSAGVERLFSVWDPAFRLGAGIEGTKALWRHGIRPSPYARNDDLESPIALALAYGDSESAQFLKPKLPRFEKDSSSGKQYDLWLQAAAQSLYWDSEPLDRWWQADMDWQRPIAVYLPRKHTPYADRLGNARFGAPHTLLEHAILAGREDGLDWLLSRAPRPLPPELLTLAIERRRPDMAARLLQQGIAFPFDAKGNPGAGRALREAVRMRSLPLMKAVLSREPLLASKLPHAGAVYDELLNPVRMDKEVDAAVVQTLLQAGFPPESANGNLLLDLASKGDWSSLDLLARQAPLGKESGVLLTMAAGQGRAGLTQTLLARGASLSADAAGLYPPLIAALRGGHAEVAALLERAGATVTPSIRLQAVSESRDFGVLRAAAAAAPGGWAGRCPSQGALAVSLRDSRWLAALLASGMPKRYRCQGATGALFEDLATRLLENDFAPLFDAGARHEAGAALRLAAGGKRPSLSRDARQKVVNRGRADLQQLLESLGVVFPAETVISAPPLSAAASKWAGTYVQSNNEAMQLMLQKNGRFLWREELKKGPVRAQGRWEARGKTITLRPDTLPPTPPYYAAKVAEGDAADGLDFFLNGRVELGLRGEIAIAEQDGGMMIVPYETGAQNAGVSVRSGIKALAYREDSVSPWLGIALSPNLLGQRHGEIVWERVHPLQWHWRQAFGYDSEFEIEMIPEGVKLDDGATLHLIRAR